MPTLIFILISLPLNIKTKLKYLIYLLCLNFSLKAQQVLFPSHHLLFFGQCTFVLHGQAMTLAPSTIFQKQPAAISSGSIKDLPFFCAMEVNVRKHTNIWIKLRAGDDASYMKMITPSK
jgi:hypothetical protein